MTDPELVSDSQQPILLTSEGFDSLHEELERLTLVKRPEIAERIRESLQHGEFSEDNSELDEVKFEQAMVETRIAELKSIFGTAQRMVPDQIPTDHVGIGSYVTIADQDFDDTFEVRVVTSIEADPARDMISNESPMGTALFGREDGETVVFQAPDGLKKYVIKKIRR